MAPQVHRELSAAGVPRATQDDALTRFRTCARDRAGEKDPATVPASCATDGGTAIAATLAANAPRAQAVTFGRAYRVGMFGVAGLMVLVTVLMLSLPRFAIPREP
ncbi:hypothetical protein [Actinoallomurus acaciae]|uniref:Uncharacterized protein n=1 Tax=Actinoallomurus acaciae TaxID=502577 RepID=A0ABV5Y7Q2_9ACTN